MPKAGNAAKTGIFLWLLGGILFMAKERPKKKIAQGPAGTTMGRALKGALIGAGIGAAGTVAVMNQAADRLGHAEVAEGEIRLVEQEIKDRDRLSPNLRRMAERNRSLSGEPSLENYLSKLKRAKEPYIRQEQARAAALGSAAKYPIPAGAALGAGFGALSAWRQKRRAKQPRRVQHRRGR